MILSKSDIAKLSFLILVSFLIYGYFGYQLQRENFGILLTLWSSLFAAFYFLYRSNVSFKQLLIVGVVFRIVFIIAIPSLSQDFYRFIWDGRMLWNGFNPYLTLPQNLVIVDPAIIAQSQELYAGMGDLNASHYTNYPPVSQFCYWVAAAFGSKSILTSVIVLRSILILADIGVLVVGTKILKSLRLNTKRIFLYFLNPFIILELSGNLHFEGLMLFFIVLGLYFLLMDRWILAAVSLGLAVGVKLIPLLFLPLFFFYFIRNEEEKVLSRWLILIMFYTAIIATVILQFLPFYHPEFIDNFAKTIGLWFQNFEFNASIYYLIRWVGYQVVGWNIIGTVGKILPLVTVFVLLILTFYRNKGSFKYLLLTMVLGITAYYLLSTTVHPWYLVIPLGLSVFTSYRFPLIWSGVIVFSYAAYQGADYQENLWLVALEYLIVIGYMIYEFGFGKNDNFQSRRLSLKK